MRKSRLILFTIQVVLMIFLFIFIWFLLNFGTETSIINNVGLQRSRVERMTKDVLLLRYRSTTADYAGAVGEIQDTLPLWQNTQKALQFGDPVQGMPSHIPNTILNIVVQMQFDYVPLSVALQSIVVHPDHIVEVQLQIILNHIGGYNKSISMLISAWNDEIQNVFLQLFWIKTVLLSLLLIATSINLFSQKKVLPILYTNKEIPPSENLT